MDRLAEPRAVERVRIDKWLWAARFFKTRSIAAHACELGRVLANDRPAKPSRELHPGDKLHIRNDSGEFDVDVLILSNIRGPAALAQTMYRETEESKELRRKIAEERKAIPEAEREGRPSKRDRRILGRLRGRM